MVLLHKTLFDPVLGSNLEDLYQFFHVLRNWTVNDLLHIPLLDSVVGHGLRQFLLDHLRHRNIKNLLRHLGHFDHLLDNLWNTSVRDLFGGSLRETLPGSMVLRYHVGVMVSTRTRFTAQHMSHRRCDGDCDTRSTC